MSDSAQNTYIHQLESERAAIQARISDLQSEVRTINGLIVRYKSRLLSQNEHETANLKNADRLFFETAILEVIGGSKRGLRTSAVYSELGKAGFGLNYNTLRSYITKMRDKGLILKRTPRAYEWIVVEK